MKGSFVCLALLVMKDSSIYLSANGKNAGVKKRLKIGEGEGTPNGTGPLLR